MWQSSSAASGSGSAVNAYVVASSARVPSGRSAGPEIVPIAAPALGASNRCDEIAHRHRISLDSKVAGPPIQPPISSIDGAKDTLQVGSFDHVDFTTIDEHAGVAGGGIGGERPEVVSRQNESQRFSSFDAPRPASSVVPIFPRGWSSVIGGGQRR